MNTKSIVSRREFLKRIVATSTIFAVPNIFTKPLFGAEAPSNCVNVGQIGCGNIGSNYHIPTLSRMPDVRIIAVADAYKSRRDAAATKLNMQYGDKNAVTAYADFREILARTDVDAVIIGAHDNWHTPMSIAAANAGKDVYCQKPLALDFSLTKILRKAVRDKNRIFQFGTQYRSMGRYRQMIQLVRNGYIGKLQRIDLWCRDVSFNVDQYHVKPYGSTEEVPVPPNFDFDAWMGPSPMVPYTVDRATCWGGYHCPETSLGFIAGCGIHELGLAQWANKTDNTSPVRYEGTGSVPREGVFRTLERWDVMCDYQNGVKLRFMDFRTAKQVASQCLPSWHDGDGAIFHGTEGWISDAEGFCASDKTLWKVNFKPSDEQLTVSPEHNRNFIDCVKSRKETMCPVEMAIRCDTICHIANIAVRTGRAIQWDPEKEKIIGDSKAAKMLARPFRKKWKVW
ncbi:MAG: Gfo/Idh/MocA family oxidoreductase [Kiritimatiellae bacterium]|nr:Gfo/Idh/MocA family oxidoreductase [Kiritimatiellia bacterium]MDD5522381.1 Gfo/Idh/MocA family oxidoreductase [Kiritimatiellia bacterium]